MAEKLDGLDWHICGKGFVFRKENIEDDRRIAREGFDLAKRLIAGGEYDLIVLDEITYLPIYDFIGVDEVVQAVKQKPENLSIIMTGRNAPQELVDISDTVSEMTEVKHGYQQGIKAQKGVEF